MTCFNRRTVAAEAQSSFQNGTQTEIADSRRKPVHEWAIVLAGGDGTRLSELSYRVSGDRRPKQFCVFFGGKTLLAHTRERLRPLFLEENVLFVVNRAHQEYYRIDLFDVPSNLTLVQPANRGTAPAILLAVLEIMQRDPDATVAVFPSDHHYSEPPVFRATVGRALRLAKNYQDRVLILGAPASYPEVEYGWIQPGRTLIECALNPLQLVSRFWEKPSLPTARSLQTSGCLWNTFVTVGLADAFVRLFSVTAPHLLDAIGSNFSGSTLDRIYSEIEPKDFSKHVLASAPERLLVLRDGPSGWTDFGSPKRAMHVLGSLREWTRCS